MNSERFAQAKRLEADHFRGSAPGFELAARMQALRRRAGLSISRAEGDRRSLAKLAMLQATRHQPNG